MARFRSLPASGPGEVAVKIDPQLLIKTKAEMERKVDKAARKGAAKRENGGAATVSHLRD